MKKTTLFCLISIFFVLSCKKDNNNKPSTACGILTINVGVDIFITEINTNWKSTLDTDDFKVIIFKNTGEIVNTYERAADMPDEIELEPAEYYIEAHSNNFQPVSFENPYYYGISGNFSLDNEEHKIITVNCELANCAVSVAYSQNVQSDFTDYYTVVSNSDSALVFNKDEIRFGYFDLKPLFIEAYLIYTLADSSVQTKLLTGSINTPQAKKHYEVRVDASVKNGTASVNIILDDITEYELIEITDGDTSNIQGKIGYGDLLITEIMYDPSTIPDAEGEWFEIYNNTISEIDIDSLVIKRDADIHVVNQEILIPAGDHYVLARSDNATSVLKYVYGTDITLTNSGADLIIANFGTDGTNGSEIASVNYGLSGFPDPSGASLNLDSMNYNVESAKTGTSWCASTIVFDTGDLGTPGAVNSSCN